MRTGVFVAAALALAVSACRRKHIPTEAIAEIAYPSCGDDAGLPEGELVAESNLRPGENALEQEVTEHFTLRRRACLYVATVHQEWPLSIADVEVVFDSELRPLRAWRRLTLPGSQRADGNADTRRYELRTGQVAIKKRTPDGVLSYEWLRGERPQAVLGSGRGLLTPWIRRANLPVGGRVREWVLDVREMFEQLRPVTLRREPDMVLPWLGRTARVYTVFGRETVFTDENNTVLGDLAGMRPAELVTTPPPRRLGTRAPPPDPLHTP